jgi:hypothetical protein
MTVSLRYVSEYQDEKYSVWRGKWLVFITHFCRTSYRYPLAERPLQERLPRIFQAWNTRPVADTTLSMCQAVERMISIPYYMDRQSFLV